MDGYTHDPVSVAGKRIVVIGGTSGLGQAMAVGFAADGADVVATSRSEDAVEETATMLEQRGADTCRLTCDVTDRDSLEALRDAVIEEFGGIDAVVASQGAISRKALLEIEDEDWEFVTSVALEGVRRVTQVFAPAMDDDGSIINISSLTARLAMADLPAYTAAKGGVEALTRASAKELAPDVRVNAIAPGFFITPQNADTYAEGTEKRQQIDDRTPLGRVGERDELIGAAIFLASDASSFVTGEVLTVDGGFADSAF